MSGMSSRAYVLGCPVTGSSYSTHDLGHGGPPQASRAAPLGFYAPVPVCDMPENERPRSLRWRPYRDSYWRAYVTRVTGVGGGQCTNKRSFVSWRKMIVMKFRSTSCEQCVASAR